MAPHPVPLTLARIFFDTNAAYTGDKVAELANHAGLGESETASMLSGLLPQVIDKITPGGGVPAQAELGSLVGSLGKLFS